MKKIILCLALFVTIKGFALLPPLAQSLREIKTIIEDKRLYDSLQSGEVIREILRVEEGYLIITTHYEIVVGVRYQRDERHIGPTRFTLEFHPPRALSQELYSEFSRQEISSIDGSLLGEEY